MPLTGPAKADAVAARKITKNEDVPGMARRPPKEFPESLRDTSSSSLKGSVYVLFREKPAGSSCNSIYSHTSSRSRFRARRLRRCQIGCREEGSRRHLPRNL